MAQGAKKSTVGHRSRKGFLVRHLTNLVISAVIVAVAGAGVSFYVETDSRLSAAVARKKAADARVEGLKVEIARVERELEKLRKDPAYIESLARANLGLVRSGDVVIKLGPEEMDPGYQLTSTSARRQSPIRLDEGRDSH